MASTSPRVSRALPSRAQVYISGGIYEQIKHKLVCGYESLGDRKVKNITDPVRVYRVLPDPAAFNKARKRRENILIFLLSLVLLVIAGGALWYLLPQPPGKVRDQASTRASRRTCRAQSAAKTISAAASAFAFGSARHPGSRAPRLGCRASVAAGTKASAVATSTRGSGRTGNASRPRRYENPK